VWLQAKPDQALLRRQPQFPVTQRSVSTLIIGVIRASLLTAAIGLLTACQSGYLLDLDYVQEKLDIFAIPTLPCPTVRILKAGEHYVRYQKGAGRDITDIEMEAQIAEVKFTCGMGSRDNEPTTPQSATWNVVVELDISIRARSGPATQHEPIESIPFFVALVNRFGQVVEKQLFSAEITFPKDVGPTSLTHKENLILSIPVRDLDEARNYETIVSFQLNQEQLDQIQSRKNRTNSS